MNMEWSNVLELLHQGRLTVYPLGVLSVIVFAIAIERLWKYRGFDAATRELTRKLVDTLVRRDLSAARTLCEASRTPMSEVFGEGLRWRNIALEDLDHVLSTARQEVLTELRRGLWFIGTVGSLAPYIGLFGTVIGIMVAFGAIAESGGPTVGDRGVPFSKALIATAVGLLVAIVSLALFNWLQVRVGGIAASFTRASERFIQGLLYVEAAPTAAPDRSAEVADGNLIPARG